MSTARRAARAQVAAQDGGVVPPALRSHDHPAWADPACLVKAGWLAPEEAEFLAGAPGGAELMRHRALDRWAEANGYDDAGHIDLQRLKPT